MNNGVLARLKYYRGQMLTARDFEDQQEYHREKQKLLLRRFPSGIIGGLVVTCAKKDDKDPADVDGFLIGGGLAVDPEGNDLVVPEVGLKVPVTKFDRENPYLGLIYKQGEDFVGGDPCGGNQKNNRVTEGVEPVWDPTPNMDSHITVAFIQLKEGKNAGTVCDDFKDPMNPDIGPDDPPVRKNARVVDTDQITEGAVTDKQIKNGAVTTGKLAPNAVVTEKIQNGVVTDTKLANNAVITEKIQNGAVNTDKLADGAVIGGKIPNLSIITDKLALDAIITNRIKDENVVATKLATDAVIEAKIKDGNVTELKLGDNAVTNVKIKDENVTDTKLATDSVVEVKIKDENVTERKLATDAVTNAKIKNGAVTGAKLNVITTLVTDGILGPATAPALPPTFADLTQLPVSPNSIIHVVPTNGGELSWTFTVQGGGAGGKLIYKIRVSNPGAVQVTFEVREFQFN